MSRIVRSFAALAALFAIVLAATPAAAKTCAGGRSSDAAMWYSIAKPGLGEWYLKGWGNISKAPQHKFWFGLIPGYGWPGYLQVISAIDAANCRTNDAYEND